MTRVAVAGFQHETNTFAPGRTTLADFERGGAWPAMLYGDDVPGMRELNIPMGGFLQADLFDVVPLLWCSAEPGGTVETAAFDTIAATICDRLASATFDAVYLDLHGAMVTETHDDGEAELLRRVRAVVGDVPVVASLDLHANVSPALAERADALAIYRTYPHVDMAATGTRAAHLLARRLAHGPFARAFRALDVLVPITAQTTFREPGRRLYAEVARVADTVISADFAFGFPPADIPWTGPSLVAYARTQGEAERAVDALHETITAARPELRNPIMPAREAVTQAIAKARPNGPPVVIADPQDNPGAGAAGNTTGLLEALIEAGADGACLGLFFDPALAARAHELGAGATFEATFGPDGPTRSAKVVRLSDGRFTAEGPFYAGSPMDLGPCAWLRTEGVDVVVSSVRAQNAERCMFSHIGIDVRERPIVAVKSAIHFMADYEPVAADILWAEAPGENPCRLSALPFTRLRKGVEIPED